MRFFDNLSFFLCCFFIEFEVFFYALNWTFRIFRNFPPKTTLFTKCVFQFFDLIFILNSVYLYMHPSLYFMWQCTLKSLHNSTTRPYGKYLSSFVLHTKTVFFVMARLIALTSHFRDFSSTGTKMSFILKYAAAWNDETSKHLTTVARSGELVGNLRCEKVPLLFRRVILTFSNAAWTETGAIL